MLVESSCPPPSKRVGRGSMIGTPVAGRSTSPDPRTRLDHPEARRCGDAWLRDGHNATAIASVRRQRDDVEGEQR
jgi:hypothetical protein